MAADTGAGCTRDCARYSEEPQSDTKIENLSWLGPRDTSYQSGSALQVHFVPKVELKFFAPLCSAPDLFHHKPETMA